MKQQSFFINMKKITDWLTWRANLDCNITIMKKKKIRVPWLKSFSQIKLWFYSEYNRYCQLLRWSTRITWVVSTTTVKPPFSDYRLLHAKSSNETTRRCLSHCFLLFFWQWVFHKWSDRGWFLHHRRWRIAPTASAAAQVHAALLVLRQRPRHDAERWYNADAQRWHLRKLPSSPHTWSAARKKKPHSRAKQTPTRKKNRTTYEMASCAHDSVCHKRSDRKQPNWVL